MIRVASVSKVYKNKKVLQDISFSIDKAGVYGFKGEMVQVKRYYLKRYWGLLRLRRGRLK